MKAPTTTPVTSRFGYPDCSSVSKEVRFRKRYHDYVVQVVEANSRRGDIGDIIFDDLVENIRKTQGVHRTEKNRKYSYHTLINRLVFVLTGRFFRKERPVAHETYVESCRVLSQPTRISEGLLRSEREKRLLLDYAYSLLSDDYKALPYCSRFNGDDLVRWRAYVFGGFKGNETALKFGCSESAISRAKDRVAEIIRRLVAEHMARKEGA